MNRAGRDVTALSDRKARVEAMFGPWIAHNCELAPGLGMIRPEGVNFDEAKRRCIAQDFFGSDLLGVRVLDLAGGLSLEFSACGARVACVESRRMNIAKGRVLRLGPWPDYGLPVS